MCCHRLLRLLDLAVEQRDEPDLPDDEGGVGRLDGRRLAQRRCP
jgi:hypothetical protein